MADEPDGYLIAKKDFPDFDLLMREFRAVGRTLRKSKTAEERRGGRGGAKKLAMTTASHGPSVTQAVNLCDKDFVEFSPAQPKDAIHDSKQTIPDDTKVYIERIQGKWRITWADICEG